MYRYIGILLGVLLLILLLNQPALLPDRFTGIWYSAETDCVYSFENGIIEQLSPSKTANMDGAYCFTRDTITLYVSNLEGMDTVQTLYWIHQQDGDILSLDPNGRGKVLFLRNEKES